MTSSKALNLRIEDEARERLDALAKRKPYSILSRHKLALIALDLGIAALDKNPQLLLSADAPTPAAPPARSRATHSSFAAADGQINVLQRVDNDIADLVPSVAEGVAEQLRALAREEEIANVPRARRRWTQTAIGRASGVAQSTVSRLLHGEEVTPENIARIAKLIPLELTRGRG
jgi:hypothetical protein